MSCNYWSTMALAWAQERAAGRYLFNGVAAWDGRAPRNLLEDFSICPHCHEATGRDEVDVGVGMIYGPWGCGNCGWSSDPTYDLRKAGAPNRDQWGGLWP